MLQTHKGVGVFKRNDLQESMATSHISRRTKPILGHGHGSLNKNPTSTNPSQYACPKSLAKHNWPSIFVPLQMTRNLRVVNMQCSTSNPDNMVGPPLPEGWNKEPNILLVWEPDHPCGRVEGSLTLEGIQANDKSCLSHSFTSVAMCSPM